MKLTSEELDELVQKAEAIVSKMEKKEKISESGKTQMSNAIDVVRAVNSIAVFRNWLRYQSVRQGSQDFWTLSTGQGTVASQVASFAKQLEEQNGHEIAIAKLILFLGFMRRAVVAYQQLDTIRPFFTGGS